MLQTGKSNCPICGHYGFLDDCDCHANAVEGKIYIATFGLKPCGADPDPEGSCAAVDPQYCLHHHE